MSECPIHKRVFTRFCRANVYIVLGQDSKPGPSGDARPHCKRTIERSLRPSSQRIPRQLWSRSREELARCTGRGCMSRCCARRCIDAGWEHSCDDLVIDVVQGEAGGERYGYTKAHRRLKPEQRYPSCLTDAEWALVEDLFDNTGARCTPPRYPRRLLVDACSYVVRTGCAWRMLPKEFLPWQNVYRSFRRWTAQSKFERMHGRLRAMWRDREGRSDEPSASVLDAQSTRGSPQGGDTGYGAGKKVKVRKRHLVVETTSPGAGVGGQRHRYKRSRPLSCSLSAPPAAVKCSMRSQGCHGCFPPNNRVCWSPTCGCFYTRNCNDCRRSAGTCCP